MHLSEDKPTGQYRITGYQNGCLQINHKDYYHSLLISDDYLETPFEPSHIAALEPIHLQSILNYAPDILIIGTGDQFEPPHRTVINTLEQHKITYEYMTMSSACRTLITLLAEKRRALGAMIFHGEPTTEDTH